MSDEKRIVSDKKKINSKGGGDAKDAPEGEKSPKKRKKLIMIIALVVILAGGAGAYFFLFAGSGGDGEAAVEEVKPPELGAVEVVDSVSINLVGGHYLRLGLGLQLAADVNEAPDTARALDLAIELFSQKSMEEVNDMTTRAELKAELRDLLAETYEGEVIDVYFTDFVTQ